MNAKTYRLLEAKAYGKGDTVKAQHYARIAEHLEHQDRRKKAEARRHA